jgi:hypothetical protein
MGLPSAPPGASIVLVFEAQRADGLPFVAAWTAPASTRPPATALEKPPATP